MASAQRSPKRARSRQCQALEDTVYAFTDYWNQELRRPFDWTYTGKVLVA